MSLIQNIDQVQEKQYLVELILNFANKTKTKVIAEGIETAEEYALLQEIGIHMGQGYAIGKAVNTLCKGKVPIQNE